MDSDGRMIDDEDIFDVLDLGDKPPKKPSILQDSIQQKEQIQPQPPMTNHHHHQPEQNDIILFIPNKVLFQKEDLSCDSEEQQRKEISQPLSLNDVKRSLEKITHQYHLSEDRKFLILNNDLALKIIQINQKLLYVDGWFLSLKTCVNPDNGQNAGRTIVGLFLHLAKHNMDVIMLYSNVSSIRVEDVKRFNRQAEQLEFLSKKGKGTKNDWKEFFRKVVLCDAIYVNIIFKYVEKWSISQQCKNSASIQRRNKLILEEAKKSLYDKKNSQGKCI